jgi:hypothetical protein
MKCNSFPFNALYFVQVSETAKSSSKINEVFYAISWKYDLSGCADPCISDLVMATKEDALRTIGHSVSKKEPFTVDAYYVIHTI